MCRHGRYAVCERGACNTCKVNAKFTLKRYLINIYPNLLQRPERKLTNDVDISIKQGPAVE